MTLEKQGLSGCSNFREGMSRGVSLLIDVALIGEDGELRSRYLRVVLIKLVL